MPQSAARIRGRYSVHSLFFKCTVMAAVCVLTVTAVIQSLNYRGAEAEAVLALQTRANEVTTLLSMQIGRAVQFDNSHAIEKVVARVMEDAAPDARSLSVVNAAGEDLLTLPGDAPDAPVQLVLNRALESGAPSANADGSIVAAPVVFGSDGKIVGAIATSWNDAGLRADLHQHMQEALAAGAVVLLGVLGAAALYLRLRLVVPMARLEAAMTSVSERDYDIEVPHLARRDEIGQMARRLDILRETLIGAKAAARDTAFKSAAFVNSSAAMMMVDEAFRITFTNPACDALIASAEAELAPLWPGMTVAELVGADLHDFTPLRAALTDLRGASGDGQVAALVELDSRVLEVKLNPARGADGDTLGYVLEWADGTEAQHNAALIGNINARQLSVEFDATGAVTAANENFTATLDLGADDLAGCTLANLFAGTVEGDADGQSFAAQALGGDVLQGQYTVTGPQGRTYRLEGSFSPVTDSVGQVKRLIFLANDVTEQDRAVRTAEAERAAVAAEQARVVEMLGVALNALAEGDLQAAMPRDVPASYCKLRDDFNDAVGALRAALAAVIHNTGSIRNETGEISSAADDLSRRTEKQAATLEETAAALDELTVSVRSAAEGADDASKMSAEAQKNAAQGGEVARQAVAAMDEIKASSQEISKITSVIDDIAFQTNLLALNAGVEAARAGDAGRGFAVVATEVRALAQRSSDAAREINGLITASGDQVNQGVELVDRTGTALSAIVTSVAEISNRVSNIAVSAREQSAGLAEINAAMNELDHVTQQNAAMFEETTAASHALTAEADALAGAVARFRLDSAPDAASAAARPPAGSTAPAGGAASAAIMAPVAGPAAVAGGEMLATASAAAAQMDMMPLDDQWEEF